MDPANNSTTSAGFPVAVNAAPVLIKRNQSLRSISFARQFPKLLLDDACHFIRGLCQIGGG